MKELEGLKGKDDKVTFPSIIKTFADEAAAVAAVDGVKDSGKVVVFSFSGKAFEGYSSAADKVTEFTAAADPAPAKVTLGTAAPAAAPAEAPPAEAPPA